MSEPTSPLLGHAPRWLIHTSRGVGNARYVVKVLLLAAICIALGVSLANLHGPDQSASLPTPGSTAESLTQGQINHPPNHLAESPAPADPTPDTVFHKLSDKITSFNPWHRQPSPSSSPECPTPNTPQELTSHPQDPISPPLIGKVTILTGPPNSVYERALRTHSAHNALHAYPMHTLRENILADVWSKPAYILSIMLRELAKPPHRRLHWLLWVDADTIIINPNVPAETFLPPATREWADVHLLVSHDWNGLNNGVFPIRVCAWSVELLAAVLGYRVYEPEEELRFRDQSAMGKLLDMPHFARHVVKVPQRWFNAYQGEINETIAPFQTRPGDLLVHFAGVGNREERMEVWLERAEAHLPEWEVEFRQTSYGSETGEFWDGEGARRVVVRGQVERLRREWERRRAAIEDGLGRFEGEMEVKEVDEARRWVRNLNRVFLEEDDFGLLPEGLEGKLAESSTAFRPIQDRIERDIKGILEKARSQLFKAETAAFTLDLEAEDALPAAPTLVKMEESMRRLQFVLQSRLVTESQLHNLLQNLTEAQNLLEIAISQFSGHEFKFKDILEEERKKAEEKARLEQEERMRIEQEVEADRVRVVQEESQRLKEEETAKGRAPNASGQGQDSNDDDFTDEATDDNRKWYFDDSEWHELDVEHKEGQEIPDVEQWWKEEGQPRHDDDGTELREKPDSGIQEETSVDKVSGESRRLAFP